MAYRTKDDCLAEAERLGLDVEGLDWGELQKTVAEAVKAEKARLEAEDPEERLKRYYGEELLISPEMKPERYRLAKYDEDLGDDITVEEKVFDLDGTTFAGGKDLASGTYVVKGKTGRKSIGQASVPKENTGMIFRPGIDVAVVVVWNGRAGYIWSHHHLPNVKDLLRQSGHLEDYKDLFNSSKHPDNVWYAKGHLVCDPSVVHHVMSEIERKEQAAADKGI